MPFLFFIVALLYACVGFGGGSSYIALLVLFNHPYENIPPLALMCNIIVVTGGVVHFYKQGHLCWKLAWPFIISSVPMAFLGGTMAISRDTFIGLLAISLLVSGLRLLLFQGREKYKNTKYFHPFSGICLGALLGLLSGLVGIGGGIFLAPIMLNLRWGLPRQVAATSSAFIFFNSISGLAGQLIKVHEPFNLFEYWPLLLAVYIGGQIGSRLGSKYISQKWVLSLTALLVIFVAIRMLLIQEL